MDRGYWLPPDYESLVAFDGFYVDSRAVYPGGDTENDWNGFVDKVGGRIRVYDPSFKNCCDWRHRRFVLVQNAYVQVIAEDADGYVAVYVIIPEDCEKQRAAQKKFPSYVNMLREILCEVFPEHISRRLNSQHIKSVG